MFFNRRNNMNTGNGFSGRNFVRGNGTFFGFIIVVALITGGLIYAQHTGYLGKMKNKIFKTPDEQRAALNAGVTQATRANKNFDDKSLVAQGHSDFANDIVDDKTLLKGEFGSLSDMYSFGKVYSMFVFSNADQDDKWKKQINEARKDGLKIVTYDGRQAESNDDTFVYRYFNKNYSLSESNPKYGKADGMTHPFMVLFVNGSPKKIVTKQSEQKEMFEAQTSLQKQADKKANNYTIPDQNIGLKSPDYGKALEYAKNYAVQAANYGKNVVDGNSSSSSSSNSSSSSSDKDNY